MRRFMLPIFAGLAIATALTACDGKDPQTPAAQGSPTPAVAASPAPKGDDAVACATARTARNSIVNDLILALFTVADEESSAAELQEAAATLKASFTTLGTEMAKAADQAESPELRDALRAYATGAQTALANLQTAGADRSKLEAAVDLPDMDAAERKSMTICD